jgi:hypothetical protein
MLGCDCCGVENVGAAMSCKVKVWRKMERDKRKRLVIYLARKHFLFRPPTSKGLSGYSNWVIQCANEIYPIVGISYVGHKLQLLALLTFLEEERCLEELGDWSTSAMKGKREVKNLESSINYVLEALVPAVGRGRRGGIQLCYEAKNSFLERRGLNKRRKRPRVCNLLRDWKVDVICFQETKLHSLSRNVVRSLWRCNHIDWCTLDSNGAKGGILIMWDTRVVEKVDECVEEFTLAVSFKNIADNFAWAFAGVYGPNSGCDRRRLWDELAGISSW